MGKIKPLVAGVGKKKGRDGMGAGKQAQFHHKVAAKG